MAILMAFLLIAVTTLVRVGFVWVGWTLFASFIGAPQMTLPQALGLCLVVGALFQANISKKE